MVGGESSSIKQKKNAIVLPNDVGFTDILFSWSLDDIFNENLFKVEKIPVIFESVQHYFQSYVLPLLEETRARLHSSLDIISQAPFAEVVAFSESKPHGTLLYEVKVDYWRNRFSGRGKEPYKMLPADLVVLTSAKPEIVADLQRVGTSWTFAMVTNITEEEEDTTASSLCFKVKASKDIEIGDGHKSLFVVTLTNITTNKRIWKALHMRKSLNIIKEILCTDSLVDESCNFCSVKADGFWDEDFVGNVLSKLNKSQVEAVLACLQNKQCNHKSTVELIWGPPGTGKTKIVSMLLFTLLKMKCRTLICAPTNVAITEVASRVLNLVIESCEAESGNVALFYSLGDVLLFGNNDRLKVNSEIEEIYLDYRVKKLIKCFAPLTGWRHCFSSAIDFFEDCVSQYSIFLENELAKMQEKNHENKEEDKNCVSRTDGKNEEPKLFLEFVKERFHSMVLPLKRCVCVLCTHISEGYLLKHNIQNIMSLVGLLESFETLLFDTDVISEELHKLFSYPELVENSSHGFANVLLLLQLRRSECLIILKILKNSLSDLNLPSAMNKKSIEEFCFQTASLVFCTASSSYNLHSLEFEPLEVLVVDEAAQLKECESTIPLQLPGIRHAVLIGDECQLPAMVESNVSNEAGFGRSLFERLSSLGHSKHLLDIQYRMHPSISCFPNSRFYFNQILDAPNVKSRSYEKHYLPGQMFGPYSFINIFGGREEVDDVGHSRKNMVEVAIVLILLRRLFREWNGSKQKVRIGVISPYAAQVVAIQLKLGRKYENYDGFSVKVRSIDGFQGSEEDVIIISTVRSNRGGVIGFMSDPRRINVALTRARHCLWILGNEKTLSNSESVWEVLVRDAKKRQCFFNADDDKELAKAILEVKKEYDQLDDLINGNSVLFRSARWKVHFSENFTKSFGKLVSVGTKTSILNLLLKLACGWRPKKRNVNSICETSSQILKQFKVEGLYMICSVDIVKEYIQVLKVWEMKYIQVLKVWDLLPLEGIPRLVKRLDGIFERYTDDFISRCNEKCLEGELEVPQTWSTSVDVVRYKSFSKNEIGRNLSSDAPDESCYVENMKVSDSLLLMKFYSLSSGVVSHLLSDCEGRELELPFEVTDGELEIIIFQRSTFILGRSGTGKTTVLTMKLYKKEQLFYIANEGFDDVKVDASKDSCRRNNVNDAIEAVEGRVKEVKKTVLHQLFVTVSPKLCYAVKHHVSQLKSFASGGKYSAEGSSIEFEDIDDAAQFKDIPDSFANIPPQSYPLVITFYKFLMMLDGTLGNSYFERFPDTRQVWHGEMGTSGSIALHIFIRTREVNFDRFCSIYWPHFNSKLTKKLDASRVYTEIMSHIKGGLRAGESHDGRMGREDYVSLSEGRISPLTKQKRDMLYDIFEDYEKMKAEKGDFDMADFVSDLHRRLKTEKYEADVMDFVYIDEVQDLTMRQIALFKHICKNVDEGFVFSGDTAQTIARGIDFRFEDIRSLFYNEFVLPSRSEGNDRRCEKGQISKTFHLCQNFRTHAGVLKLAQSVIDLLYCFFPSCVDVLSPETSLIFGEAPILLESSNDENAIVTIFGKSSNAASDFVGFGAEQVILVRDDPARKEIYNCVGKQALVLTVVECKGLEFQDVLLYNFFGSSPMKNKWRVVYEYMNEQGLLDGTTPSFPNFDLAKHNVLCSELKQLYVAITRTRQRLWICENIKEFSKPMFDYWKKKGLVQVRKLDNSLAQAMQVASSPEEWKSQGYQLLRECNYEMATMCFERAGDQYGEKLSKAAGLKANADRMRGSNPEMASVACRQAAEIFESIGKAEYAAECFYMLHEYDRAGRIYLQCGESAVERAGECFCLAGNYEVAAEVYAKGSYLSMCLSACTKGKLFDMGLQYIQDCKRPVTVDKRSNEMDKLEQEFLENCAHHFYNLNDNRAMMRYVRAFDSISSIRTFLNNLGCHDELLSLEEESGNFLEAAKIAKLKGELLLEADLLEKGGHFKGASMLILWFVFVNSLWSAGSKGWPLKQFGQKEELLTKAKLLAKNESEGCYELVHMEAEILSHRKCDLFTIQQHLNECKRNKSIRGEILSARKILDAHLDVITSGYSWENELVLDLARLSEEKFLKNQVSAETLVYSWNFWKDKVVNIFKCLGFLEMQDATEYGGYGEFCMNYLGVRRQFNNLNAMYSLMNAGAEWVRDIENRFIQKKGNLVSIDVHHFVSAARSYWSSELLFVGKKVLIMLEELYKLSMKNSLSLFCQSRSLVHIYEVAKFLLDSKFIICQFCDNKELQKLIRLATQHFHDCIYPQDWRDSLKENMISLRRTDICRNLLKEIIFENLTPKKNMSYGQVGKIALVLLGSSKKCDELIKKIADSLNWNSSWKVFIEDHCRNVDELSYMLKLHGALIDTYNAYWRREDYISPSCFLYLVERQLILLSYFQGYCLTTKSSFVEWLIYQEGCGNQTFSSMGCTAQSIEPILKSTVDIVQQFLYKEEDTMEWIRLTQKNVEKYHAVVVLRLFVLLCLLYVNFGWCDGLLFDLLGRGYITKHLPRQFYDAIRRRRKNNSVNLNVNLVAKAFNKISNPLVIVSFGKNCSHYLRSDAIFVDMKVNESEDDIFGVLFPKIDEALSEAVEADSTITCKGTGTMFQDTDDVRKRSTLPSSNVGFAAETVSNTGKKDEINVPCDRLWGIFEALASENLGGGERSIVACNPTFKVDIGRVVQLLSTAMDECFQKTPPEDENKALFREAAIMLGELKQLYAAFEASGPEFENGVSTIGGLLDKLRSRKPRMETFLNRMFLQQDEKLEADIASDDRFDEVVERNKTEGSSNSDKEKMSASQAKAGDNRNMESKGKGNNKNKKNKGRKGGRKGE